jgi:phosphatidylglycerophosphate synthase
VSKKALFVNALTFARVPLIFLWAAFAIWQELDAACGGRHAPSLTLAVLASLGMLFSGLTDLWDGKLARQWGVVSALGKMADPLMDKVFYLVAFPVLVWHAAHSGAGELQTLSLLGLTVLYLLRDTWVTFLRSVGTMYGADVGAMWLGKVRTALSFPGAGWIYVYLSFRWFDFLRVDNTLVNVVWPMSVMFVEALLAVLTFVSLVTYTRAYMPYLKRALERKENL